MFKKVGKERLKLRIKKIVILMTSLLLILGLFKLFHYYGTQRKLISEFKDKRKTNNK